MKLFCTWPIRKSLVCAAAALLWGSVMNLPADTVFYGSNSTNPAYDDIGNTLTDVYGNNALGGTFNEVNYGLYQINGTGPQSINMTFLYDDGAYTFSFGYFEVTSTLAALPYDTVAEKQAWAIEALSTAQVVFVDQAAIFTVPSGAKQVTRDTDDAYTTPTPNNDQTRNHDRGNGDTYDITNDTNVVTLEGGRFYSFFIIPNNSLEAFLNDAADNTFTSFALDGTGASAWPLFAVSEGNPGNDTAGAGTGLDQAFTFFGTTRNNNGNAVGSNTSNPNFAPDPNSPGSVITFEDITRRTGGGSDDDFNDLHFYIDNTLSTGIVVPEPSTWITGAVLLLLAAGEGWRRRRRPHQTA
ncbi:MAG: DUF4114 domain-containing protein [Candidatus Methylacidiphilales bacterium]|nr:DUF4114 domain-containing protein [Candidatus Methylacidiphilales bacterium]